MAEAIGKIDLHMHTTASDGTDTPEGLIEAVGAAGISLFSVTDHDGVEAAKIIPPRLKGKKLRFLSGVEFSCRDDGGKYHILGYGFDPLHEAIRSVVDHGHELRMKKVTARLDFLKEKFGFAFSDEDTAELLSLNNPGKPHIGNLMVKYGFAKDKKEAIDVYINQVHFKNQNVSPEEAIEGILKSGGIPVLAHPFYGSGSELILVEDMKERLGRLKAMGLQGLEAYYSGFSVKMQNEALSLAREYDLYVTAGSDYHGANKLVRIGDTGLKDTDEYPPELLAFLEAALGS